MSESVIMEAPRGWHRKAAVGALEANLWSMWSILGRPDRATLIDTPELFAIETPVARIPYNVVLRTRADGRRADELIDERIESCRRRRVPLVWMITPTARPLDIRDRLAKRNMVHADSLTGMIADITDIHQMTAPAPDGIELVARRPDEPDDWVSLVSQRYGVPADQIDYLDDVYRSADVDRTTLLWVALKDGRPVSKAAVRLADGVAGVHGVATTEEARGLGLARTCTLRALQDARRRGYTTTVLHATPMAVSLYHKMGFTEVAPFELYAEPGTLHLQPPS